MTSEASNSRFDWNMGTSSLGFTVPPTGGGSARFYQHLLTNTFSYIASGQISLSALAQRLTRIAELAYGARDVASLKEIIQVLLNVPLRPAQHAGLYYSALVAKREGNLKQARIILESLTETAFPVIKARSIQTLATVYECQGDFDEAVRLHLEAARAARDVDGFTLLCAFYQTAAIKGDAGDHEQAVNDLESLWPIVRVVSRQHPHLFYQYHNELAVELAAIGRIEEARKAIDVAMSTPISKAYPEWQETAAELAEPISAPFIAVEAEPAPADRKSEKQRSFKDHFLLALITFAQKRRPITDPAPKLNLQFLQPRLDKRIRARGPPRAPPFPSSRAPPSSFCAMPHQVRCLCGLYQPAI